MFVHGGKCTPALAVLVIASTPILADFHILNGTNGSNGFAAKAVPSNHYSCLGWRDAPVVNGLPNVDSTVDVFSVRNLCGVPQLNFYNNGGGCDVYVNDGDGTKIGACVPTVNGSINGDSACPDGYAVFDAYVCMTYVCG